MLTAVTGALTLGILITVLLAEGSLLGAVRVRVEPTVATGLRGRAWWEQLTLGVVAGLALATPGLLRRVSAGRLATPASVISGWWVVSVALLLWVLGAPPRDGIGPAQQAYRHAVGAFWWSSLLVLWWPQPS